MKNKILLFFAGFLCLNLTGYQSSGQSYPGLLSIDAVRYGQTYVGGTARFRGLGGTSTSLGADISSISGNPAGLGFYNSSAASISPIVRFGDFSSAYLGNSKSRFGGNFQVPNMGFSIYNKFSDYSGSGWQGGSFGIAINQSASFYNDISYEGTAQLDQDGFPTDFLEFTLQPFLTEDGSFASFPTINSTEPTFENNIYSDLAERVGLLEIVEAEDTSGDTFYFVDRYDGVNDSFTPSRQTETIRRRGGLTNIDASYGANYNDMLYLGIGVNIAFMNYNETRVFREYPEGTALNYFELEEEKSITGAGVGVTLGAIVKPIPMLNLGLSYSSPTIMGLNETQTLNMTSYFSDATGPMNYEIINEAPRYTFISPQRLNAGATFFLGKYGFISADVEFVDYGNSRYSSDDSFYNDSDQIVREDLQSVQNYKIGAEGRLGIFRARAGYALYGNPYQIGIDQNRNTISGGVGIKKDEFFVDVTYSQDSFNNQDLIPYTGAAPVSSSSTINSLMITVGTTF